MALTWKSGDTISVDAGSSIGAVSRKASSSHPSPDKLVAASPAGSVTAGAAIVLLAFMVKFGNQRQGSIVVVGPKSQWLTGFEEHCDG